MTFVPSISFTHGDQTIRLQVCAECAATVVDDPRDGGALLRRHAEWHEHLADLSRTGERP